MTIDWLRTPESISFALLWAITLLTGAGVVMMLRERSLPDTTLLVAAAFFCASLASALTSTAAIFGWPDDARFFVRYLAVMLRTVAVIFILTHVAYEWRRSRR